ncbi:HD family phosphohydrolase [Paenibacillus harenae]|uniref:Nucleotidyltransferase with HDIG domain n=1 Tax=Paenibacillus harenae TaxID=306543 RepID=A0ABT9TWK2_PAEHA|nr:HDIG domain-containing metalloprotein [Paenibacillus harenae]MDQ0058364.1 putative nucleotidyltransferase with HDIG domain [Paenibacillus harenae]MDQ0111708.1 putative nucleotidyltransferase with HDIG domain [Paenibacillus harenae]
MNQTQADKQQGVSQSLGSARWKQSKAVQWVLLCLFVLLFYFSLAPHLVPETYDIQEGAVSEKDIKAPFQIKDEKATRQAEEDAAERIDTIYSIVPLRNEALVEQILVRIEQLNMDDQVSTQNKIDIYRNEIPGRYSAYIDSFVKANKGKGTYNDALLEEMSVIAKDQQYTIPEEAFYKMPNLTAEELAEMRDVARDIVRKLTSEQLREAETARTQVAELVNASSLANRTSREIVQELARFSIMPNKFLDKQATDDAKALAKQNTPPVIIKEGDLIVKRGQTITPDLYQLLVDSSLLQDKKNYWPQLGLLIMSIMFTVLLFAYLHNSGSINGIKPKYNNSQLLMLWLVFLINMITIQIVALTQTDSAAYVGFLAPAAMGTMLITLLLDIHLAIVSSILFAIMGSILLNTSQHQIFDFEYGFFIIAVSFAAIFSIHRASQRSTILKAGIMVSLFGSLSVIAMMLLNEQLERMPFIYSVSFAFASGLVTAVLVIGLMPFFEITFGILSALKLVELSNPNHPLLRKLLTETPGTYHHSVMVGNLSEAAAEAIGADGLLCRVGSFYHDIGKTKRPNYFIENQTNIENPHDTIDPKLSKSIIVAHARDGVDLLKGHNIPKPIRDIAEQHHGTTSLKYFYHKAYKQAEEQGTPPTFTEDDFRYPGPKAQSKEAAVVGIADCVEAAVRSLRNPTVEQIEAMIHKIIKSRLDDNQYNECDLTLKELDKIAQSLKESVIGIFHSRIEYPDDVKSKERLA